MHDYSKLLQQANWLSSEDKHIQQISKNEQHWILLSSSLTEKLKLHFGPVRVNVLSEGWVTQISDNEKLLFQQKQQRFWCREVSLYAADRALVFARTLIPETSLSQYSELQKLGNTALGEWLFSQQNRVRKVLQWTHINQPAYYARRALVEINHYPIMVAEIFLDAQIFTREEHE